MCYGLYKFTFYLLTNLLTHLLTYKLLVLSLILAIAYIDMDWMSKLDFAKKKKMQNVIQAFKTTGCHKNCESLLDAGKK